jgi:endonuclease/exonuclease/phosphatase family metal-dependent hydrolase
MSNVVRSASPAVRCIHQVVVVLIALCAFTARVSAQTTVTLSTPGTHINADLYVQGGTSGWVDFSTSGVLATKKSTSDGYNRRIMLKFDTENYIPANAVIQSAQLYLVLKKAENSEARPLTAYNVTKSFVKHETNWFTFRTGQAWSRPGGDIGSSFGTTYVGNSVGVPYKFNLTSLVQRVVKGEFGSRYTRVELIDTGVANSGSYREFYSTRTTNTALRPRLVITYGTSTTTTAPTPSTSTSSTGTTLRVMQWNIRNAQGSDSVCNPDRIANVIVRQNVHVVSLNEVKYFAGECAWTFDMGAKLQTLLRQKTGVTWYLQSGYALSGGRGGGNVLLSRYTPVSSTWKLLSYGRTVVQTRILVNGRYVNLFSTHVDYYNSSYRYTQITQALSWFSSFSEPRIVMGDLNTWPFTNHYYLMAKPYQDAWEAGLAARTAWAFNGTGVTVGASRFDYVFYSRVAALVLKSVKVPDPRVNGVYPSDHYPVVAEFVVK